MTHTPVDPVALTADLIRCPSVTPVEGGALVLRSSTAHLFHVGDARVYRLSGGSLDHLLYAIGAINHRKLGV